MRSRLVCLLSILALTACQQPSAPNKPKASAPANVQPTTAATDKPAVAASLLQKPSGDVGELAGTLHIDAAYVLGAGRGNLISQDGSTLISQDGGGLMTEGNSGTLIGQDGASILLNSGALISQDGGGLMTEGNSGTLIGNDGAGLVAQGGGNLISKRKYALAAAPSLPLGTTLRAAGMDLQVVNMGTGEPYVLGQDEQGNPVTRIVTNAAGEFKVYLPAAALGDNRNLRIAAMPPGKLDDRLDYNMIVYKKTAERTRFDEDTALLCRYIREVLAAKFENLFIQKEEKVAAGSGFEVLLPQGSSPQLLEYVKEIGGEFSKAADSAGAPNYTHAQRRYVALRAADAILDGIVLGEVKVNNGDKLVMDELHAILAVFNEKAALALRQDPQYFDDRDFYKELKAVQPAGEPLLDIIKPADLGEFCIRYILSNPRNRPNNEMPAMMERVFVSLGMVDANNEDRALGYRTRLSAAGDGMLYAVGGALIANPETRANCTAVIAKGIKDFRQESP